MRRLACFLRPYRLWIVLGPLAMLVEVVCDLLQPHFLSTIIDQGLARGDWAFIVATGGLMLVLALVGAGGGVLCSYFASKTSLAVGRDLRNALFAKVLGFSFANLDRLPAPTLITRITSDVTQVQGFVLMMLRIMVRAPLLCVGGIVMAVVIDPVLALATLGSIPLLFVVLVFVLRRGFPLFGAVQRKVDGLNTVMRETLVGIRVVKAFVRADHEEARFGVANEELARASVHANRVVGTTTPLMMVLMNMSIVLLLWLGGSRINGGILTVGQILALITYVTQILFSLMMSAMLLMGVSRAQASFQRIQEVLDTEPDLVETGDRLPGPGPFPLVEFDHVSFHYPGQRGEAVLHDVSFSVYPGQTVAILGATGAGKSALVNLMARFYDPVTGTVRYLGTDVRTLDARSLRGQIGLVPQEALLFSGTVRDNLLWGNPAATDEELIQATTRAQAHEFLSQFPRGYDTVVGQKGVNLSGGQKQRLCLARALVRRPRLLVLDDSTSAVDLETEAKIQRALNQGSRETACLLVAQRISSVLDADLILVLDGGSIVSQGTHEQLLAGSPVYQEIYRSQTGEEEL